MPEEKKKKPDEGTEPEEKKPDAQSEGEKEKSAETDDKTKENTEEKPADDKQADENGEGADKKDEKPDEKQEENPAEKSDTKENKPDVPQLSETDKLKAENLRLKTENEAMKIGFNPDVVQDAVVLAEDIVKREGVEITAALQSVAKKYPDWKSGGEKKDDKSKGGFKVGADSEDQKNTSDDRLRQAFGIKKKDK